ncbi:MAG: hypothetical protein JW806_04115 [Sedimentisphaerales bacterium]|nr:hypothetical protein [Sedimentisphaerales bacterium]
MLKEQMNLLIVFAALAALVLPYRVLTDGLNPPVYRGDPLAVYAQLSGEAAGFSILNDYWWVNDRNPTSFISPFLPGILKK